MTQWSREYLYTGTEKQKTKPKPLCENCRASFSYCITSYPLELQFCTKKGTDVRQDYWCPDHVYKGE